MVIAVTFTGISPPTRAIASHVIKMAAQTTHNPMFGAGVCVCGGGCVPKRSLIFLTAAARGMWLVSEEWARASMRLGSLADPSSFERVHPSLDGVRTSRESGTRVLAGMCVAIVGQTVLDKCVLSELLFAAGAVLQGAPAETAALTAVASTPLLVQLHGTWRAQREAALLAAIVEGRLIVEEDAEEKGRPKGMLRGARPGEPAPGSSAAQSALLRPGEENQPPQHARAKRARRQPAATPGELLLADDEAGQGSQVAGLTGLLLSAQPGATSSGTVFPAGQYFLFEDAVNLYRQRLPKCNVDIGAQERDFLQELVDAPMSRTALLQRVDDRRVTTIAACTFVYHGAPLWLCELQLLAVSGRHARRGLGTLLLRSVERWLTAEGVQCIVTLSGLDTVNFWRKRGYTDPVTLEPAQWAALRDPFGSSMMLAKVLQRQGCPQCSPHRCTV